MTEMVIFRVFPQKAKPLPLLYISRDVCKRYVWDHGRTLSLWKLGHNFSTTIHSPILPVRKILIWKRISRKMWKIIIKKEKQKPYFYHSNFKEGKCNFFTWNLSFPILRQTEKKIFGETKKKSHKIFFFNI